MVVLLMGCVFKFSNSSWRKYLELWLETGNQPDANLFAKCLTMNAANITDWEASDVEEALISCRTPF